MAATTLILLLVLSALLATTGQAADTPFLGYPSPWAATAANNISDPSWAAPYAKAIEFVSGLTLTEKVNLTTGTGWEADRCIGNTGSVPRLGFRGLCLEDGPLGVRYSTSGRFLCVNMPSQVGCVRNQKTLTMRLMMDCSAEQLCLPGRDQRRCYLQPPADAFARGGDRG
jgi:hypothetical protein